MLKNRNRDRKAKKLSIYTFIIGSVPFFFFFFFFNIPKSECFVFWRYKTNKIKELTKLVGRLSLTVEWENGPERRLKTVSFNP